MAMSWGHRRITTLMMGVERHCMELALCCWFLSLPVIVRSGVAGAKNKIPEAAETGEGEGSEGGGG
jgi:hypothetical protein